MTEQVGIHFTGENRSAVAAARGTREAIGTVTTEAKKADAQLEKTERQLKGTTRGVLAGSGAFQSLGRSVAFASASFLGAAGFTLVVRDAIDAAVALDDATDAAAVTFGRNAKQMQAWSKTTVQSLGLSERAALSWADKVGRALKAVDTAPEKTAAWSKEIVALARDLGELTGKDPEQFIEAFDQAVLGRTRGLKQWDIAISDVDLQAEALRLHLVKSTADLGKVEAAQTRVAIAEAKLAAAIRDHGKQSVQAAQERLQLKSAEDQLAKALAGHVAALTPAQRAEALYQLVLKKTADAHGFYAKQAGDADVKAQKFRAALENLEAQVGTALLPVLGKLADEMTDWLSKSENQEKVTHAVQTAVNDLEKALRVAVPMIEKAWHVADHVADAVGGWKHAIELLLALKFVSIIGGWTGALTGSKGLLPALRLLTKSPWTVRVSIALVGADLLYQAFKGIHDTDTQKYAESLGIFSQSTYTGLGKATHGGKALRGKQIVYKDGQYGISLGGYAGTDYLDVMKLSESEAAKLLGVSVKKLSVRAQKATASSALTSGTGAPTSAAVMRATAPFAGVPYQWGGGHGASPGPSFASGHGRTGLGLDCSGYARAVLKNLLGIDISGTADGLLHQATSHPSVVNLAPGDLVFYEGIHPQHVMVYIGGGKVIGETHTGASGPEIKAVNYMPITGTGRYWPRKGAHTTVPQTGADDTAAAAGVPTKPKVNVPSKVGTTDITKIPAGIHLAIAKAEGTKGLEDDIAAQRSLLQVYLHRLKQKGLTTEERADLQDAINETRAKIRDAQKELADQIAEEVRKGNERLRDALEKNPSLANTAFASVGATRGGDLIPGLRRAQRIMAQRLAAALKDARGAMGSGSSILQTLLGVDPNVKVTLTDEWGRAISTTVGAIAAKVQAALDRLEKAMASGNVKAIRAAIAAWKNLGPEIAAAVSAANDAAAAAAQASQDKFQTAFQRLTQQLLTAFDRVTQRELQGMQRAFQAQVDGMQRDLDQRIAGMQRELQRKISAVEAAGARLTPSEQALKDLQDQHDSAQSAADMADAQAALAAAQQSGDAQAAKEAQARVDDLVYQQRIADLQKLADEERKIRDAETQKQIEKLQEAEQAREQALRDELAATIQAMQDAETAREQDYQDQRDAQRQALDDQLAAWQQHLLDGSASMEDFISWLNGEGADGLLAGADIPNPIKAMFNAGQAQGSAFAKAFIAELQAVYGAYVDLLNGVQPTYVPPKGGGSATAPMNPQTGNVPGAGHVGGFARGGKVPGRYVGREDTLLGRVTPGETYIDRSLTKALEDVFVHGKRGPGGSLVVTGNHFYGATERQVHEALARATKPYQGRIASYTSPLP